MGCAARRVADIADIADDAIVILKAPGGKRIEAAAAPLKAIIGAMVDLLMDPKRREGPIKLQQWDAVRVDRLREQLMDTQAARAGPARYGPCATAVPDARHWRG